MNETEMAKAVVEAIELRLKPIRQSLEQIEKESKELNELVRSPPECVKQEDINRIINRIGVLEKDSNEKFEAVERLVKGLGDAFISKHSAKWNEGDLKDLKILEGERS